MTVITTYLRTGGRPPEDDEQLDIHDDGAWRLRRTMGGARVGTFAGHLDEERRRELGAALASAEGAHPPEAEVAARDAAREAVRAGEARIDLAAGRDIDGPWRPLLELLRRWSGALATADDAEAALELRLEPDGPILARLGAAELRTWPATLHVDVYARDADGVVVGRASAGPGVEPEGPRGEVLTTTSGWMLAPELPRAIQEPASGTLEAWAWLDITGPDGPVRARLVARRGG